ncbi:serine/threonine-protein kinase [Streptacidiphilus rugosus]|uniref:serine/threonine-protein kinase n=1 Tax=Streptacidiphilus rugosus TaxID=405783 RepID=UPI00068F53CC|nr:serine/threonine-protein kinase [Streptacidiphilus rugosus]
MKPLQDGDPKQVGPYRIIGLLGAGGMGRVYLGHREDGVTAAVKVINEELAQDSGFRERFRREVAATGRVGGPWIAAVVDHDVEAEQPWLATEYVPFPSLHTVVTKRGPLETAAVRQLGARLAEALTAIHAAHLVHRDVKPGNILVSDDGPRLIDFGIARGAAVTTLTQTGVVMGTPQYMAPEQLHGRSRVGPAADVFALGLVLAFAATGEHPFGQTDSYGFGYRIVHEEPELDALPAQLAPLIARCLAKDPAERPSTEEIVAALRGDAPVATLNLLAGPDGGEGAPTPVVAAPAAGEQRRPRRRVLAMVAAAAVVLGLALTPTLLHVGGGPGTTQAQGGGRSPGPGGTGTPTAGGGATAGQSASSGTDGSGSPSPSSSPTAQPSATAGGGAAGNSTPTAGSGGGSGRSTGGSSGTTHTGSGTGTGTGSGAGGGSASTPTHAPTHPPTPSGSPPGAMAGFSAYFHNACVGYCADMPLSLTWNAKPGATRYDVRYSINGASHSASTAGTAYTVDGPASGDKVCVALRAANQYGASAWTQTYCFDTPY